jgi:CCR4-NOT transcription complex subunit 6
LVNAFDHAPNTLTLSFICTCRRDFKATLDYVLYTRDSLAPAGLLELPAEAEVVAKPGDSLPNANWSSDHVCLMAEFQILQHKG